MGLAPLGDGIIELADHDMPGLGALKKKYSSGPPPLDGMKISASLHVTAEVALFVLALRDFGAEVRWASCNVLSTQEEIAASLLSKGIPVFAWKGQSEKEYWECLADAFTFGGDSGPDLIVDDGGDASLMVHRGYQAEDDPSLLGDTALDGILRDMQGVRPGFWHGVVDGLRGLAEQTTSGVTRLIKLERDGKLLFPAIVVNDCVTKSKFDNIYGCRQSLLSGLFRATDRMVAGKHVCVCGYGEVGKGSAQALRGQGAFVFVTEADPICALQACMDGFPVVLIEDALPLCDIFVAATGNRDAITVDHMRKMRELALVCNIGHMDVEVQTVELGNTPGVRKVTLKPQVDKYTFPEGNSVIILGEGKIVNLSCASGHPSFVMSTTYCGMALALISLARDNLPTGVHRLPKKTDEEIARLHLDSLGAKLTVLTPDQCEYIGVDPRGPYKEDNYRY